MVLFCFVLRFSGPAMSGFLRSLHQSQVIVGLKKKQQQYLTLKHLTVQSSEPDLMYLNCCPGSLQVELDILWNQCSKLWVQRGALFLRLSRGPGWLLLPFGWPGTGISGFVSWGQCLQWRLLLHQHVLGLVWQRVWVAGEYRMLQVLTCFCCVKLFVLYLFLWSDSFISHLIDFLVRPVARKWHGQWQRCPLWHNPKCAEFTMFVFQEEPEAPPPSQPGRAALERHDKRWAGTLIQNCLRSSRCCWVCWSRDQVFLWTNRWSTSSTWAERSAQRWVWENSLTSSRSSTPALRSPPPTASSSLSSTVSPMTSWNRWATCRNAESQPTGTLRHNQPKRWVTTSWNAESQPAKMLSQPTKTLCQPT